MLFTVKSVKEKNRINAEPCTPNNTWKEDYPCRSPHVIAPNCKGQKQSQTGWLSKSCHYKSHVTTEVLSQLKVMSQPKSCHSPSHVTIIKVTSLPFVPARHVPTSHVATMFTSPPKSCQLTAIINRWVSTKNAATRGATRVPAATMVSSMTATHPSWLSSWNMRINACPARTTTKHTDETTQQTMQWSDTRWQSVLYLSI